MTMAQVTPHPAMLPYALAYARRGWPVFPLHTPTRDGGCSCGKPCGNPGKHPRTKHGHKQATTDEEQIRRWWAQYPDANIGIATGHRSGILAVDVDPKNGGAGTWQRLTLAHDLPPLTVTVVTGSGGWHLYYRRPSDAIPYKSKANAIKPGIDTRCDDGYVVAPPSLHVSGERYAFRPGADPGDTDVQPCPPWLLTMLYPDPVAAKTPAIPSSRSDGWLLTAFRAAGLYLRALGPDRDAVRCPWAHEHSAPQHDHDTSTVIFRPTADHTLGHYHCSHAHCSDRTLADIRAALPPHAVADADAAYPSPATDHARTVDPDHHWQAELPRRPNGELDPTTATVVSILTHDDQWRGVLAYDEFGGRSVFRRPPPWYADDAPATPHDQVDDTDDVRLSAWMRRRYNIRIGSAIAHDAIDVVAQRHGYHPVREYLASLSWDGVQRLPTFAATYLGADPASQHYAAAPLRWLIAAVRRVHEPGCQSDSILVFEGLQGAGKSSMLRTLASDPWFADELGDPSTKDSADALRGKWIIEIGELKWRRSDEDARKAFISRRIDHYRPAYGRRAIDVPRQCVLAASTNESAWQTDPTGARRYWVVACRTIDQEAIERDRDQLWAEAMVRYQAREPSWLQDDEVPEQRAALEARREQDPWEGRVAEWLASRTETTVPDVLTACLDIDPARQSIADSRRVARILRVLDWDLAGQRGGRGRRVKLWAPKP